MSKHLTDSERLHIVKEYLGSTRSKYAIEKKYNIAQGLIKDWLRKFTSVRRKKTSVRRKKKPMDLFSD